MSGAPGSLAGMRIGVVRESLLIRPGDKATVPVCTVAAAKIKAILGASLWERDRDLETMNRDFR
jgi:hypothetical protein